MFDAAMRRDEGLIKESEEKLLLTIKNIQTAKSSLRTATNLKLNSERELNRQKQYADDITVTDSKMKGIGKEESDPNQITKTENAESKKEPPAVLAKDIVVDEKTLPKPTENDKLIKQKKEAE